MSQRYISPPSSGSKNTQEKTSVKAGNRLKLNYGYSSLSLIGMIKPMRMKWPGTFNIHSIPVTSRGGP
jgi:hypothetical protein